MTRYARGSAPVRHRTRRGALTALRVGSTAVAALAGFALVSVAALAGNLQGAIDANDVSGIVDPIDEQLDPTDPDAGRALDILLIGTDVRTGENGDIGGDDAEGMRSDTTMLMHISADRARVELVSIPRDAQVDIADCTLFDGTEIPGGHGDFNVAFSNGGRQGDAAEAAACTINTVQHLTGISIEHFAVLDFVGFERMVDALGGVEMCIPFDISSKKAHLELTAGQQTLTGAQALGFARLRTAEVGDVSGSDLQRISRQQALMGAVADSLLAQNILTDAGAITQFLKAVAGSLTTDTQLGSVEYLTGLAWSLRGIDTDDIVFATVPWEYTPDFLNVELLPESESMWQQLRDDEPLTIDAADDASSTWDDGSNPSTGSDPTQESGDSGEESVTDSQNAACTT
ncbi:LCP family protein [Demequina sp. NBRC 110052]|uniref:LCP family protein n=1 Tax=Demequina sp. NBRC 110052 TaxID=1570341 RepID=UPI00117E263B|nr:LCP family protein [Demequina sp. NBRC 110052]